MNKKFNLAERFKKNEMNIDKKTADELINNEELEEAKEVIDEIVREEVILKTENTTKKGVVVGCNKLNVRIEPSTDSSVIFVISNGDEVEIDTEVEHPEFYRITNILGASGYCMKKYIFIE